MPADPVAVPTDTALGDEAGALALALEFELLLPHAATTTPTVTSARAPLVRVLTDFQ